jgi:hypothetical protein
MATRLQATLQSWAIFLKDLKGTKGINVGAREQNEILRFRGRFYDGVLTLFPKKIADQLQLSWILKILINSLTSNNGA